MNCLGTFLIKGIHYKYVSESSHNDLPPPGKHFLMNLEFAAY